MQKDFESIELSSTNYALLQDRAVKDNSDSKTRDGLFRVYPRRWFVLLIVAVSISLRGFNQSCYGPTNNVFSNYFAVESWQVDWLVVVQSVVFLLVSFPMTLLTTKIGYRLSVVLITATQTAGFIFTVMGAFHRTTFGVILFGQAIMGFSNIISWSIPPATAAIWFSKSEVATAVAVQVVGRGIGEAIGSFLPTALLKQSSSANEVKSTLVHMFTVMGAIAFCSTVAALLVVRNGPATPPSEAQAKTIKKNKVKRGKENALSTLKQFFSVLKTLFSNNVFIAVWFVFGAVNPILRNNNVLLTSILRDRFEEDADINTQSGIALLVAWSLYTLGGFVAGPLITITKAYKEVVLVSVTSLFVTCAVISVGVNLKSLPVTYAAVAAQGLFIGLANTSLFELLAEVTYPVPPMFVTMVAIVILGLFRLTFPLIGRLLLIQFGPTWSTVFPVLVTLICSVVVAFTRPTYEREKANKIQEVMPLIQEEENES